MKEEASRRRLNRLKESPRLKGDSWIYYENWLNEKTLTTQWRYLRYFIGFMEWIDTDSEGLYNIYLGMIRDKDPRKRKKMGILVLEYKNHLKETMGVKGTSSQNAYWAIKGFFKANELPFEFTGEKITRDPIETPNISLEQISTVLSATGSYKTKAFIKVGRDSGLRAGDITNLPIRVVRAILDDPNIEYFTFEWKQRKTGEMANPVLGPESLDAIRVWMNYRVNTLKISAEDGDPIFCVENTRKGFTTKANIEVTENVRGGTMDDGTMGVTFANLVKKANLKPLPGNTRRPTFHSLRVFHKTTLEHAGVPTSWINRMQGRKGEGTGGIYTKPNSDQLIKMFKKGYHEICGLHEDQTEKVDLLTRELGLREYENAELREDREKYRLAYQELSLTETVASAKPGFTSIIDEMKNLQNQIDDLKSNR